MRKAVSGVLVCLLASTAVLPLYAQKRGIQLRQPPFAKSPLVKQSGTRFDTAVALTDGNGVLVRWQMQQELNNVGFYVYRINNGERTLLKDTVIPGAALHTRNTPVYGEHYAVFDPAGSGKSRYSIEAIQIDGRSVSSQIPEVTYVPDLREAAGDDASLVTRKIVANALVEDFQPAVTADLATEIKTHTLAPDINTQRWVASQPGAKIGVNKEGFYRVTKAQLQAIGFDVNSDPNMWQLYTDGNQQAINVGPGGDYIEFYGRGIDTPESNTKMYYLVVGGTSGARIPTVIARRVGGTVVAPSFVQTAVRKERTNYVNDILNGDAENYWGRVVTATSSTFSFTLSNVDTNVPWCSVVVRVQGFSTTAHSINLSLNGQTLPSASGSGVQPFVAQYTVPCSSLQEGTNGLAMSAPNSGDFSFFDSVSVTYSKKYAAESNQLSLVSQNYRDSNIGGFSSANIRVFDVTYDGQAVLVDGLRKQQVGNAYSISIPANRSKVYYAVEDSGISQPVSITLNNPSSLSTAGHSADLVIISYKDFMTQANAWADYRRGQGFAVEVVNVEDVFDEFNYGVLSAHSMKDFLLFAKNNWQLAPRYVLLIGDGDYDSRNYEGFGFFNYVPANIVNTVFSETASDDSIVDFNGDGLAEMAIGRIPARTAGHVTNALNKTATFEQPAMQSLSRGALFACDVSTDYDFCGMSGRVRDQLPAGTPNVIVTKTDLNASGALVTEMNAGKYITNYSGHGATGTWAAASFFSNTQASQLTNINNPTIYTMLTCLNGFYHNTVNVSLAETLLNSTSGGAVAAWASSGLTTPDVQEIMGKRFYNQIGLGNITRMGDLIIDAKTVVPGGSDVRESWVLLGDPMLKVR